MKLKIPLGTSPKRSLFLLEGEFGELNFCMKGPLLHSDYNLVITTKTKEKRIIKTPILKIRVCKKSNNSIKHIEPIWCHTPPGD